MNNPVVNSYLLEHHFLQYKDMQSQQWIVQAYRGDSSPSITLKFESILHSVVQEKVDIIFMQPNIIYFLNPRHPAIDAVCVSENILDNKKYLLLMQASLSAYKDHKSKFDSIRGCMDGFPSKTIAEYYSDMLEVAEDCVLYLYISPKQLVSDSDDLSTIFNVSQHDTRSGGNQENYLCGALEKFSPIAVLLDELTERITNKTIGIDV